MKNGRMPARASAWARRRARLPALCDADAGQLIQQTALKQAMQQLQPREWAVGELQDLHVKRLDSWTVGRLHGGSRPVSGCRLPAVAAFMPRLNETGLRIAPPARPGKRSFCGAGAA